MESAPTNRQIMASFAVLHKIRGSRHGQPTHNCGSRPGLRVMSGNSG